MKEIDLEGQVAVEDILSLHKELVGLRQQKKQHEAALREIGNLLKEYKKNKNQTMQMIVGGNLVRRLSNKECVKSLTSRYEVTDTSLTSINGQISHRGDLLMENYAKLQEKLGAVLDEDN